MAEPPILSKDQIAERLRHLAFAVESQAEPEPILENRDTDLLDWVERNLATVRFGPDRFDVSWPVGDATAYVSGNTLREAVEAAMAIQGQLPTDKRLCGLWLVEHGIRDEPDKIRVGTYIVNLNSPRHVGSMYVDQEVIPSIVEALVRVWDSHKGKIGDAIHLLNLAIEDVAGTLFPDEWRVHLAAEEAKKAKAKKGIPQILRTAVFERDQYRCCHCRTHIDLAVDHVVPESKGGPTTLENLQTLCRSCNSRKGANMP